MGSDSSRPLLDITKRSCTIRGMFVDKLPFVVIPDHPVEALDISQNRIRELPRDLTRLKQLDYSFNNLGAISESLASSLLTYSALAELKLSGNNLTEVPPFLEKMNALTSLYLNSNKITRFVSNLPQLEVLELTSNLLNDFEVMPPSLVRLGLAFNRIVSIDFTSSTLQMLFLAGNDIRDLPNGQLFDVLTVLDLSFNKLTSISTIGRIAPKLEKLSAMFNMIEEFPAKLPETIEVVTLSTNRITEVPDLSHLKNLKRLKLDGNFLKELPNLPDSIEFLDVDNNRISKCGAIRLRSLKNLVLAGNMMDAVPAITNSAITALVLHRNVVVDVNFANLCQTLVKIDLTNNHLKSVPGPLFSLPQLRQLILSNNQITEIPSEIEDSNLFVLNVSENPISTLPTLPASLSVFAGHACKFESVPEALVHAKRLSAIDMSYNKLKSFPEFPAAEYLLLSCNCIEQFDKIGENIRVLELAHNRLRSFKVDEEFEFIHTLDVSFNELDNCEIGPLPELRTLRVSHNSNLAVSLKLSEYPSLDCVDVSRTNIVIQPEEGLRIREIIYDQDHPITPMYKTFTDPSVGYSETMGNRQSMEDSLIIQNINGMRILAVIDGHGGSTASTLTAFELPPLITEFSVEGVASALNKVNRVLRRKRVPDGATIALVVQKESKIIAANIGDSRALIVRSDASVVPLGYDHKPYERSEMERLRDRGAFVMYDRVGGILAISRALGDFSIIGVTATPCILEYEITEADKYIVIACDGVFDVISNDEVGPIVVNEDCPVAASKLVSAAFARSSDDNISAIVAPVKIPA